MSDETQDGPSHMVISDLIEVLQGFLEEHGDLMVCAPWLHDPDTAGELHDVCVLDGDITDEDYSQCETRPEGKYVFICGQV